MTKQIDSVLAKAVERGDVPGVVGIAVNATGVTYEGTFGQAHVGNGVAMPTDAIFTIASMTKGLTSLASMQVVDDAKLSLDSPVGEVLPELAGLSVLTGDMQRRPAARPVTIRHLLTHTSGFSYEFTSPELVTALATFGVSATDGRGAPTTDAPLLFDPGERWQYGPNTDWVGKLIEQVTSKPLPGIAQERLFDPLGMTDSAFGISEANAGRRPTTHLRQPDGSLVEREPYPPAMNRNGGAGMTATAHDYAHFLQFMLGDGRWEGQRLLSENGMRGLSSDQIPGIVAGKYSTGVPAMSFDADFSEGGTAGHSLGFVYSRQAGRTGRSAGTLSWGGLFNTYYWIDRAKGVGGAIFFQILPFADPACLRIRDEFETAVFEAAPRWPP